MTGKNGKAPNGALTTILDLLFFINFSSFKQNTENNANFENYASHCLSTGRSSVKKTKF